MQIRTSLGARSVLIIALFGSCNLFFGGCGPGPVYGQSARQIGQPAGNKSVHVYHHPDFPEDGRHVVSAEAVIRQLRDSGQFSTDEVAQLAPAVKLALGGLGAGERVVIESGAVRRYHIWVDGNDLVMGLYEGPSLQYQKRSSIMRTDGASPRELRAIKYRDKDAQSPVAPAAQEKQGPSTEQGAGESPKGAATTQAKAENSQTKPPMEEAKVEGPGAGETGGPSKQDPISHDEAVARIQRLVELREQGLISEEDYQRKRKELLDRL